jgi:hypothetical protein
MDSFYSELINLKQELLGIREDLDDPRLRSLTFELPNGFVTIQPKLTVTSVPEKLIGLPLDNDARFTITAKDLYIKNVPRNIDKSFFNYRVWLDAVVKDNLIETGVSCRVHVIEDKKGLSYNLVLREEAEQVNL